MNNTQQYSTDKMNDIPQSNALWKRKTDAIPLQYQTDIITAVIAIAI